MTQLQPAPSPDGRGLRRAGRGRADRWERRLAALEASPAGPAAVAAGALGLMAVLQVVDPNEPGHYPTCPFLLVTGWWCPGCGSMRMLHHLGDGDLPAAAAMNPFALALLPVLVLYWLAWLRRTATGRPRGMPAPAWVVWGFAAVTVVFTVLRNLPGTGVLAPG